MATTVTTFERLTMENGGNPPTTEQLIAALASLESKATTKRAGELTVRVSVKGGVSVYGLGRFPVTLYASQWEKLNETMPSIMDFVHANLDDLASKDSKEEVSE